MIQFETGRPAVAPGAVVAAFDYASLPIDEVAGLKAAADRIRSRHRQQIDGIIATGRELTDIKASLGHGRFGQWIAAEFDMSERSAQNYMNAFATFGAKSETVADLPATVVYQLAAAPEPIREKVLAIKATEGATPASVRDALRSEIATEKANARLAGKTPEQRAKEKAARVRYDREMERRRVEYDVRDKARKDARDRLAALLVDLAGDRLPELVAALERTDYYDLASHFGAKPESRD